MGGSGLLVCCEAKRGHKCTVPFTCGALGGGGYGVRRDRLLVVEYSSGCTEGTLVYADS